MARIHQKDTRPELVVRRLLHRKGYRYRLHAKHLPGRPDIVFPRRRKVIFVHGCFWHRHPCCKAATIPKTNTAYWLSKFAENRERDAASVSTLECSGWKVAIVWECQTIDTNALSLKLISFLEE